MAAVSIDPHPLLEADVFAAAYPRPLGEVVTPPGVAELLRPGAASPFPSTIDEEKLREAVRTLLRHGGFKPTGRSKPASEYLLKAVREDLLGPINAAVDLCNAASLHSGLPISVVDLDKVEGDLRIGVAPAGASYVFNASGQTIDLGGLLCLHDAAGPCANAVKDAQRTKTSPATTRTLTVIWGTKALPGRAALVGAWYRERLAESGATC
jgi:DNA/RNA-binding domain of Phe-tRNA-synthetase-like protein